MLLEPWKCGTSQVTRSSRLQGGLLGFGLFPQPSGLWSFELKSQTHVFLIAQSENLQPNTATPFEPKSKMSAKTQLLCEAGHFVGRGTQVLHFMPPISRGGHSISAQGRVHNFRALGLDSRSSKTNTTSAAVPIPAAKPCKFRNAGHLPQPESPNRKARKTPFCP